MKNVLVTGSRGYIASNFIKRNEHLVNIIEVDKLDGNYVLNVTDFEKIDYIIHLAAISGIKNCEINHTQTIMDNVTSTLHLMKNASKLKIPMIFASSQGAKFPTNTYSMTKKICEIEATYYNHIDCSNIISLRFANIYGGLNYLESKTSVVANFINNIKNDKPITIDGNGTQIRDFIHVDDVCEVIERFCTTKIYPLYPVDVGTGVGRSINELALMMGAGDVTWNEERIGGVTSNIADPSSLNVHINFKPDPYKLSQYIRDCF